jgi:transposase-like protein
MEQGKPVRRNGSEWRKHMDLQPKSGMSVGAYCRKFDLGDASFYAWRKRLSQSRDSERKGFIQLKRQDISAKRIHIETPQGYRVEIESGTDAKYVGELLSLLRG